MDWQVPAKIISNNIRCREIAKNFVSSATRKFVNLE